MKKHNDKLMQTKKKKANHCPNIGASTPKNEQGKKKQVKNPFLRTVGE